MKFFLLGLLTLVSTPAFIPTSSAEDVFQFNIENRGPSFCRKQAEEIKTNIEKHIETIEYDGQWFVTWNELSGLCNITLLQKYSSYEFVLEFDRVKASFKKEVIMERFQKRLAEVLSRDGYIWHTVYKDNPLPFFKGREIMSLHMKKRAATP